MVALGAIVLGVIIRRARYRSMAEPNVTVVAATHTTTAAPNYGAAAPNYSAAPPTTAHMPQPASNPAYSQVPTSPSVPDAPPAYADVTKS